MMNVRHEMLSMAVGVTWTTMTLRLLVLADLKIDWRLHLQTQIQLTKPAKACPRARIRVVVISLG